MAKFLPERTLEEHTDALARYLPNDELFEAKWIPDSNLRLYLQALCSEMQRYFQLLNQVADELDILKAQDLITEWETMVGIPCTCFDNSGTLEERRRNVLIKLVSMHGQTAQDFINLAALLGFEVEIETAQQHGMLPLAFPIYFFPDGKTVKFTFIVTLPSTVSIQGFPLEFKYPFLQADNALLRCLFEEMKPANVQILYRYS